MKSSLKKSRSGFVLVEAIIALSVFLIGFTGLIVLLSDSIKLTRVAADDYTATYLAAEGVEVAKNLIDANHIQGRSWNCGFTSGSYELTYGDTLPNGRNCNQPVFATACNPADFLYYGSGSNAYDYKNSGTLTNFSRCVHLDLLNTDSSTSTLNEVRVVSTVNWSTGGQDYSTSLEDHFFNWRP